MTTVKICGITNIDDSRMAAAAGADMLGFNFYENSPRYITEEAAKPIVDDLPPGILTVGVFVNGSLEDVERVASNLSLDFIQLHGDESPGYVDDLRSRTSTQVIKVIRVSNDFQVSVALDYGADHFMLDTDSRIFGGSGRTFDWENALKFKELVPQFFLAGGLDPENISDAIRKVRPFAVDVCSGVESSKRRKDPAKVAAFVHNAKNVL